jgi:ATP-binding protein involved in chromosome partitioning
MPPPDEQTLRDALRRVRYPGFSRDIVSFGLVKEIRIEGESIFVQLVLTTAEPAVARQIRDEAQAALAGIGGVRRVEIRSIFQAPAKAAEIPDQRSEGVEHVIAVASGRGVGKSTVAANLAVALAATAAPGWVL